MIVNRNRSIYSDAKHRALSNGQQYHLAAFLRRKGRIIRVGVNTDKTHPRFKRQYTDGTWGSQMHAEMNVLRFAQPGDELEVARYLKCGNKFAMARPCDHCVRYIQDAGISSVKYTNTQGEWEKMYV